MRVLVTGAGGMLGHSVISALERWPGTDVVAISGRAEIDLEKDDESRAIVRFVRPNAIIHLAAAVFGLGGNLRYPADVYRSNVRINTNIIDAAHCFDVKKIVVAGTSAIYSDSAAMPFREEDCLLGEPHHSEYAYATAKRAMLVQLKSYEQQYGLNYAYAIATNMYGPHDRFDPAVGHVVPSLISKFLTAATSGGTVEVWGDGTPTRDFLHSFDAAEAILLLLKEGSGPYNVASGTTHTIKDLVKVLSDIFPDVAVSWNVDKPNGQRERDYNIDKLRKLGFSPKYNLVDGIRHTVNWCRGETRSYQLA